MLKELAIEAQKFDSAEDFIQSVRLPAIQRMDSRPEVQREVKLALARLPDNELADKTVDILNLFISNDEVGGGWFEKAKVFYTKYA